MARINVEDLKEGMVFDSTVFIEDNMIFVPPNIAVRKSDIDKLIKWKVAFVETEGKVKSSSDKYIKTNDMWGITIDDSLLALYKKTITDLDVFMEKYNSSKAVEPEELEKIADSIISCDKQDGYLNLMSIVLGSSSKSESLSKDSIDCSIISAAICFALKLPEKSLRNTVIGALVHDIGMLKIPLKIVNKSGKLNADELKQIHSHTLFSYKEITKVLNMHEEIALIALQHHERWDGEGYPQGLKSDEINYEARIVSVADAFRAMITIRPYRESMVGYDAMKNILSDNSKRFDPEILKVFIRNIGIYPLGSLVMLNDSSICRVIEINSTAPLRPSVKILIDASGEEFKSGAGAILNLIEQKNIYITRAINMEDINNLRNGTFK